MTFNKYNNSYLKYVAVYFNTTTLIIIIMKGAFKTQKANLKKTL